jgi:hypothetical protein
MQQPLLSLYDEARDFSRFIETIYGGFFLHTLVIEEHGRALFHSNDWSYPSYNSAEKSQELEEGAGIWQIVLLLNGDLP